MAIKLPKDFKELFKSFNKNGVKYLLIGGYAVAIYGYVRTTIDIDIVVSSDPENADRLVKALTEFGFGGTELDTDLFTRKDNLVRMGAEPMKIEILNYLNGVNFDLAYGNRMIVVLEEVAVNLISLDDLIANKKATGRHKDLADIEGLERFSL